MNRKVFKGVAVVAMLLAAAMSLSACSFMNKNGAADMTAEPTVEASASPEATAEATAEPTAAPDATATPAAENTPETEATKAPDREPTVNPDATVIAGNTEPDNTTCAYEEYQNKSATAQKEFIDSFDSVEEFFVWLNDAKAEHEAHSSAIVIDGNTIIDMSGEGK